jgi:hypothetical protein
MTRAGRFSTVIALKKLWCTYLTSLSLNLAQSGENNLARITIVRPDGATYEVHVVALRACPYDYASKLARRHQHLGHDFKYLVEVSGEISGPYGGDEITARAFLKKEFDR